MDKQQKAIWFTSGFVCMSVFSFIVTQFIAWFSNNKIQPGDIIEKEGQYAIVISVNHTPYSNTYNYYCYPIKPETWTLVPKEDNIRKMNYQ